MNRVNCQPPRATNLELERMIEPLASYIRANDRPRAALVSALNALFDEVEQTHRAASTQVAAFSQRTLS